MVKSIDDLDAMGLCTAWIVQELTFNLATLSRSSTSYAVTCPAQPPVKIVFVLMMMTGAHTSVQGSGEQQRKPSPAGSRTSTVVLSSFSML